LRAQRIKTLGPFFMQIQGHEDHKGSSTKKSQRNANSFFVSFVWPHFVIFVTLYLETSKAFLIYLTGSKYYSFPFYLSPPNIKPMRILVSVSLLISVFVISCTSPKETKSLTTQLDSLYATHPDFSGVVLVAEKGKPVYHKAFGYRNFETKTPTDTATIFELASVSKQFTGVLIMMLKEAGKLDYDDLLEKYVPGLPYQGITIRHLLHHTSGLPDYFPLMSEHWDKSKVAGNDDVIAYLKQYHPEKSFEPNERYEYSNTGYIMLGAIVEKVSGKEFISFAHERIFTPVNMTVTDIRTAEQKATLQNFALGHMYVPEKQRYVRADSFPASNYTIWVGGRKGPGRISSTTTDLLKWDRALYTENLIKKESLNEAFTPSKLKGDSLHQYGFGWELRTHPTLGKVVWHGGDNPGYKSAIVRYIDADKTVIMLHNNVKGDFYDILAGIDKLIGN
jgi:CubicO group peptidase (beta-lactamase class C family)